MKIAEMIEEVMLESERRYGPPASTHEGYGVLAEELAELLEAVRANEMRRVGYEAIDIAAAAIRLAQACFDEEAPLHARSTKA